MARISEQEFYNDKDVITQIEWLKANLKSSIVTDIQLTQNPSTGEVMMTFTYADGTSITRSFATTSVVAVTGSQSGDQMTLTFHLANGQTYDVTFTVTVQAIASWASLTGTPDQSISFVNYMNGNYYKKAAIDDAMNALGGRVTNVENNLTTIVSTLKNILYPVGALYITTKTDNPASYLGFGTWELYGEGKVLVCRNSADADYATVGQTGGGKTISIAEANMPSHTHTANNHTHTGNTTNSGEHKHYFDCWQVDTPGTIAGYKPLRIWGDTPSSGETRGHEGSAHSHPLNIDVSGITINATGGNTPIDVKNPYIVVMTWIRTS